MMMMEVRAEDGNVVAVLEPCITKELGRSRSPAVALKDPTVSRRQLILELQISTSPENDDEQQGGSARVYLEVTGPNPICIHRSGAISPLEYLEKGQHTYLGIGDRFSLSVKEPHFFTLKKEEEEEKGIEEAVVRRQRRTKERKHEKKIKEGIGVYADKVFNVNMDPIDLSWIDPVEEFGFLVEGSEFELFGKRGVNDLAHWDWQLGKEHEESSDDADTVEEEKPISGKAKSKKKKEVKYGEEDTDWIGESEEENKQRNKLNVSRKPTIFKTRSKSSRGDERSTVSQMAAFKQNQVEDSIFDDDDDETLGGFIVDDDAETTDEDEEDDLTDDDFDEEDENDDVEDEDINEISIGKGKPLCKYGTTCYRKNKKHLEEFIHKE